MTRAPAIIDTHCHLDVEEFDADRDDVIQAAQRAGVSDIVIPAIRRATWIPLLELCGSRPFLHPALGLHPVFLGEHRDTDLECLDALLRAHRPRAVGEIGLDFLLRELDRERQLELCRAQLELAARHRLPVILHVRKAHDEMLALLCGQALPGGFVHAFNGSLQQAYKYLDRGFCLGFGGMLTHERSRKLRALASSLPLQGLVLETDAPDMAPAGHQGARNSPEYLPECLAVLASLRDLPEAEVAAVTSANARRILRLDSGPGSGHGPPDSNPPTPPFPADGS